MYHLFFIAKKETLGKLRMQINYECKLVNLRQGWFHLSVEFLIGIRRKTIQAFQRAKGDGYTYFLQMNLLENSNASQKSNIAPTLVHMNPDPDEIFDLLFRSSKSF